jgi:hypothetical protein
VKKTCTYLEKQSKVQVQVCTGSMDKVSKAILASFDSFFSPSQKRKQTYSNANMRKRHFENTLQTTLFKN